MLALIYKDLLVIKSTMRSLILWFVIFGAISLIFSSIDYFSGVLGMFATLLPMNCLTYDHQSGWESYALTTGISRRTLALSRYLLTLIFITAAILIVFFARLLLVDDSTAVESLLIAVTIGFALLFFIALMLPLMYRFGVERSRIILLIIVAMFFVVASQWKRLLWPFLSGFVSNVPSIFADSVLWLPILSLLCYGISALISCRIYAKKEF